MGLSIKDGIILATVVTQITFTVQGYPRPRAILKPSFLFSSYSEKMRWGRGWFKGTIEILEKGVKYVQRYR